MDDDLVETMTGWRRHLHAHPELSRFEVGTSAFVQERLRDLRIPFVVGIAGNGVVATMS